MSKKPTEPDSVTMEYAHRLDAVEDLVSAVARAGPVRNMTVTQLAILTCIRRENPVPLKEVAQTLHLKKPLVSRAMDRFEEQGFAKRYADPHDRRSVQLGLTYKGRQFLTRIAKHVTRELSEPDGMAIETVPEDPA